MDDEDDAPEPERYLSPALRAELARWPPMPAYQDSAGGLTLTPLRPWGVAQQRLLQAPIPASIKAARGKIGREHG